MSESVLNTLPPPAELPVEELPAPTKVNKVLHLSGRGVRALRDVTGHKVDETRNTIAGYRAMKKATRPMVQAMGQAARAAKKEAKESTSQ